MTESDVGGTETKSGGDFFQAEIVGQKMGYEDRNNRRSSGPSGAAKKIDDRRRKCQNFGLKQYGNRGL